MFQSDMILEFEGGALDEDGISFAALARFVERLRLLGEAALRARLDLPATGEAQIHEKRLFDFAIKAPPGRGSLLVTIAGYVGAGLTAAQLVSGITGYTLRDIIETIRARKDTQSYSDRSREFKDQWHNQLMARQVIAAAADCRCKTVAIHHGNDRILLVGQSEQPLHQIASQPYGQLYPDWTPKTISGSPYEVVLVTYLGKQYPAFCIDTQGRPSQVGQMPRSSGLQPVGVLIWATGGLIPWGVRDLPVITEQIAPNAIFHNDPVSADFVGAAKVFLVTGAG